METDINKLDTEDLLNILGDRFTMGIGNPEAMGESKETRDWRNAVKHLDALKALANQYLLDAKHIR